MGDSAITAKPAKRSLLSLPLQLLRLPFDLLFLACDFLRVTWWGITNLPAVLVGAANKPFRPRFEGGILQETPEGALWYCPLARKYGTKSLLRLFFPKLKWHTDANGRRYLCWTGSSKAPPTGWPKYLLTGILLAILWGVPLGALAWHYRHHLPLVAAWRARPVQDDETVLPSRRDPQMALQLAAQAVDIEKAGKTEEARAQFRDAAARDPNCVPAHLGVARTCLELGLTDDARQAFERVRDLDPAEPQAMMGLARVLHQQGADRKALEELQTLLERQPDSVEAYALQATCLSALGEMEASATAIEKALALAPTNEEAIAIAADLELQRGNFGRAESYYRTLVDQNAQNTRGRVGLARVLRFKGNTREAETLLRALLQEKPGEIQATEEIIDVLLSSDRPLDGLALCRETIDKHPERIALRQKLLGILLALGRDNELYVAASKLLADNPGNASAHVQLATMFLRKNLPTLAVDHCHKALAQAPGMENAHRLLMAALIVSGDLEQARTRLERLLTVFPQDLDGIAKLAECYRRQGQMGKATELLRKGVGYHPGSTTMRSQLAQMLFLSGDMKASLAEFREAYRLTPDDPKALNNLAAVLNYADGDVAEAMTYAEKARKLDPRNPQVLDTMAWGLMRRGDLEKAVNYSEMAVAIQPDLPILRYHHGAILAALGRNDEAKAALNAAFVYGTDFHGSADARALLQRLTSPPPVPQK